MFSKIIDDSVITTCDEIIEGETKTITVNFIEKNTLCETNNFYISHAFFIFHLPILVVAPINCQLIRYKTKQKHLVLFHVTNNELKEIMY